MDYAVTWSKVVFVSKIMSFGILILSSVDCFALLDLEHDFCMLSLIFQSLK